MISLEVLSNPLFWIFIEQLNVVSCVIYGLGVVSVILMPFACLDKQSNKQDLPVTFKQLIIGLVTSLVLGIIVPTTETVYKALAYSTGASIVKTVADSPHIKQLSKTSLKAVQRLDEVLSKTEEDKK